MKKQQTLNENQNLEFSQDKERLSLHLSAANNAITGKPLKYLISFFWKRQATGRDYLVFIVYNRYR